MPERRRFLAPMARRGDGLGYVDTPHQAMPDEPECLTSSEWDRHVAPRSDQTEKQRRTVEEIARDRAKQLLSQEERIRNAHAEATASRRDVTKEMWVLNQMIAKRQKPELIEKRLQGLERVAYLGRAA